MIRFDHMAVDARDAAASARFMAGLLGVGEPVPEGADDDMFRVDLEGGFILFSPSTSPRVSHVAFRVDVGRFREIVERLRSAKVSFGNDHDDTANGRTEDPLGGTGRVYFQDGDGHLWEVTC